MGLIELFFIAVGLSMDAFAVSVCKGLAMKQFTWKKGCAAGLWFGGFQGLMPAVGYLLGVQFKEVIVSIDHWIAFILLGIIGGNMVKVRYSCKCVPGHKDNVPSGCSDKHRRTGRRGDVRIPPSAHHTCSQLYWHSDIYNFRRRC